MKPMCSFSNCTFFPKFSFENGEKRAINSIVTVLFSKKCFFTISLIHYLILYLLYLYVYMHVVYLFSNNSHTQKNHDVTVQSHLPLTQKTHTTMNQRNLNNSIVTASLTINYTLANSRHPVASLPVLTGSRQPPFWRARGRKQAHAHLRRHFRFVYDYGILEKIF